MKESFYFPHDNNAHNDPKLMTVFMKTWLSWIGLYWILIENMHQQENWMITEEQYTDYINWYSSKENRWTTLVEQLLNIYLTTGLFCKNDEWMIYSKRVLENKDYRENISKKRSEAWKKSWLSRWYWTSVEQVLNKWWTRKGKERKGKEIKTGTIDNFKKEFLEQEINKYPEWSVRRNFYLFLKEHIPFIKYELDEKEIIRINKKLWEFLERLWDLKASLVIESFIEHHRTEKTEFKSIIGRLNTFLINKIWK